MAMKKIFTLIIAFLSIVAAAQHVDTMTGIFDENLRTLQVQLDGDPFAEPIALMNSDERIYIAFDRLAEDREFLRYSLTHCNANWQPSGLVDSEFLDGFNEGTIENYDFSQATTVHYVHYWMTLPNEDVAPKISGNYLLKIYSEDDPDIILAQARIMFSEETALTIAQASPQTDIDYNKSHQQLTISVDVDRAMIDDPFNDILIVVGQNGRLDSQVSLRQPLRMNGATLYYEHQMPLIFEAGNEYRRFETVNVNYPGMGVAAIEYHEPYYHFSLYTDERRDDEPYVYDQTQHGRFFIREYNSDYSDVQADYAVVHFTLDYPDSPGAMIFLDGDFTLRRFDDNARMFYNHSTGLYERSMLLKQGAYNYQYLIVPPDAKRGYTDRIEGDKYQTLNRYDVRVYTRRKGERYDRLIGTTSCRTTI